MQTVADILQREGVLPPRVTCAVCAATTPAVETDGWKVLLGRERAPALLCPTCLVAGLRQALREGRAAV